MAKINLLPWRAERRKARQQEFLTMLGVAALAAVLISLLIVLYYNGQIDGQNNRNKYLTDQIALLNTQIAEIKQLDEKKAGLLRRKKVIEDLQARRSQMVHLFDELARTIADGTQITSLAQNGNQLSLTGRAQSNARVSTYMRNLAGSGWMANPDLSVIELRGANAGLPNEFQLKVELKDPNAVSDAAAATADATSTGGAAPVPAAVDPAATAAGPASISPPTATPTQVAPVPGAVPAAKPQEPAGTPPAPPATNEATQAGSPATPAGGTP
jgi:type IV pilus assembly protein PilN